jgi:rubrerythrin
MAIQEYQIKIIELYRDQELLIAELYDRFARQFPRFADFWDSLASEEREHAGWISHLLGKIGNTTVTFDEGKTRSYTLTTSINHVTGLIATFDAAPFELKRALSYTVDLEKSLIEKSVFERFAGDSAEVAQLLNILSETQQVHLRRIETRVAEIRAKLPPQR